MGLAYDRTAILAPGICRIQVVYLGESTFYTIKEYGKRRPGQHAMLGRRTAGHREDEHDVEVKGMGWLGIRTAYFEQTVALFRDVMNLEVIREEHDVVGLRFPDDSEMEVWRPSDEFHSFFTTGPVVGFRVDDAEQGRAQMEAAGIEFIGPLQHSEGAKWTHFRGPDGNIYEIYS